VILWTWTAALSGFVLFPLFAPESNAIIPFAAIVLGLLLFTLFRPGLRSERRKQRNRVRRGPKGGEPVSAASGVETLGRLAKAAGNGKVSNGKEPAKPASPRIAAAPDDKGPRPKTAFN
jgi:hypothetical protein